MGVKTRSYEYAALDGAVFTVRNRQVVTSWQRAIEAEVGRLGRLGRLPLARGPVRRNQNGISSPRSEPTGAGASQATPGDSGSGAGRGACARLSKSVSWPLNFPMTTSVE
jgi:hypothetical protein